MPSPYVSTYVFYNMSIYDYSVPEIGNFVEIMI